MSKESVVSAAVQGYVAPTIQAMTDYSNSLYDAVVADVGAAPSTGGISQADEDAAIAAAVAPLHASIDALTAQDKTDKQALADLKIQISSQLQNLVASLAQAQQVASSVQDETAFATAEQSPSAGQ